MKETKIFAVTKAAKEKIKNGWKPCNKKKSCACGKPGANLITGAKPEGDVK